MGGLGVKMRKILLLPLFACLLTVAACSGSAEKNVDESGVDKMTSDAAAVVVDKVKSPLDKARMTQGLADKHLEEVDQRLQGN